MLLAQSSIVLPLSAATMASLEARVEDFASFDFGDTDLLDLAYTLGSRRTNLAVRGFLIARREESIPDAFKTQPFVSAVSKSNIADIPFAFVFTGQGSQWPGMCRELFSEFPVFRDTISEMDSVLQSLPHAPDWLLREAVLDTDNVDLIHTPQRSQPCCTAIQVALMQLLASWGILPAMTVGHSSGEIAAAFAAGHVSAAEAIVIAYYRGYCVSKSSQDGAMMAVGLSEQAAMDEILINGFVGHIRVACMNSPEGVTVSGDSSAIDKLFQALNEKSVFARKLKTGGQAYHSHHMQAFGQEYEALLDRILPTLDPSAKLPKSATMMSSVTVEPKSSGFTASYWRSNLESQVRFTQAIEQIQKDSEHYFIELGPHPSLELPVKQTLTKAGTLGSHFKYSAPIKRNQDALETALGLPGTLWLQGYNIDWSRVNGLYTFFESSKALYRVVTDLPPYRFNYESTPLWHECRASVEYRQRKYPRHELLGSLMPGGNGRDFIFRNVLKVSDVPWLEDHKLETTIVFPGSGYLAMAMEAIMQTAGVDIGVQPSFRFSDVNIMNALALSTDKSAQTEIFTSLHQSTITNTTTSATWWDFNISTYADGSAVPHAAGSIAIHFDKAALESKYQAPLGSLESSAKRTWYEKFIKQGLNYGPDFQSISNFQTPRMKSGFFCSATAPLLTTCGDPTTIYPIHPITLDAMIQLAVVAATNGTPKELRAQVPTKFTSINVNTANKPSGTECSMNSLVQVTGFGSIEASSELVSKEGAVIAQFDQCKLTPYQAASWQTDDEDRRHPVLRVLWKPDVYGLGFMTREDVEQHVQKFADEAHSAVSDDGLLKLGAMLDLMAHKNPRARILELGNNVNELTLAVLDLLAHRSDFKKLSTYSTASFTDDGSLSGGIADIQTGERSTKATAPEKAAFDLILIPAAGPWIECLMDQIKELMAEDASILALCPGSTSIHLTSSSDLSHLVCPVAQGQANIVVARQKMESNHEALQKHKFLIVEREKSRLGSALADALRSVEGHWVMRVKLHELTAEHIPAGTSVFNLCELKSPLLSTVSDKDMLRVKIMTDRAASLVWVTNENVLCGGRPDFALVAGQARQLVLEQPSL